MDPVMQGGMRETDNWKRRKRTLRAEGQRGSTWGKSLTSGVIRR